MATIDDYLDAVRCDDHGVPYVPPNSLTETASCGELSPSHIRKVKANLLGGALGASRVDRVYGTLAALRLINSRLPPHLAGNVAIWRPGESYAEVCRRRLDLLNGLYPEW